MFNGLNSAEIDQYIVKIYEYEQDKPEDRDSGYIFHWSGMFNYRINCKNKGMFNCILFDNFNTENVGLFGSVIYIALICNRLLINEKANRYADRGK